MAKLSREEVIKWLHEQVVIDAHCDTLIQVCDDNRDFGVIGPTGHLDLPRLESSGVTVQFMAAFIGPEYRFSPLRRGLQLIDVFYNILDKYRDRTALITGGEDIDTAKRDGKIGLLLAVEGGEVLQGELSVLRVLHRLGVRALGLTWNHRNEIADGISEDQTGGGLTKFGRQVIIEMNNLGMLIDVSHLSDRGFWDVLALSRTPVIASHSNSRSLCSHPRNLSDEQVKALAANGGVIGMNFYPAFVDDTNPSLARLLDHIEHICSLVGPDHLGLGSDFDGFEGYLPGLEDVTRLPGLTEGLFQRGFKEQDIKKILGQNFCRVITQVMTRDAD